jgi:hypothetical protein
VSLRRIPGPAELLGRGRQWATTTADRLGLLPWRALGAAPEAPSLPFPAITATAAEALDRPAILARADLVLSGHYPLLGVPDGIAWGVRPDWHRDPLANRSAPLAHFSRVPYLDAARVGDHKVTMELNRHQWLVWLAQASVLTGDAVYRDAIEAHLEHWLEQNPRGQGVNWASSLEVAFRAIAWTWVLHLLPTALPSALQRPFAESLHQHGQHVERWLSTWFSPNTHLTGEALALLYLGVAFPQWSRAHRWRDHGWRILREQALVQLRPDGSYFEQTGWYQGYSVDFYLHALALAAHAKLAVPDEVRERVHAAASALHAMTRRDGAVVRWGDDDGGRLLPLGTGVYGDVRDTLAYAAVQFRDPALLPEQADGPTAHTVAWLLGAQGLQAVEQLIPQRPVPPRSTALRDGGWVALRSIALEAFLVAGPHSALTGAHAHADALALEVTVHGVPVLADPGTYHYVGPERDAFRRSAAHCVLTVGEGSSATPGGPFRWARSTDAVLHAVALDGTVQMASAWHDGYAALAAHGRGRVWRELTLLHDDELLLVIDRVEGTFSEPLQVHWRPPAGVHVECDRSHLRLVSDVPACGSGASIGGAVLATVVISSDWQAAPSVSGSSAGYAVREAVTGATVTPSVSCSDRTDAALLSVVCPGRLSDAVHVERCNTPDLQWRVSLSSRALLVRLGAPPVPDLSFVAVRT